MLKKGVAKDVCHYDKTKNKCKMVCKIKTYSQSLVYTVTSTSQIKKRRYVG